MLFINFLPRPWNFLRTFCPRAVTCVNVAKRPEAQRSLTSSASQLLRQRLVMSADIVSMFFISQPSVQYCTGPA